MPTPTYQFQQLDTAAHGGLLPQLGLCYSKASIEHSLVDSILPGRNFDLHKVNWQGGWLHITGLLKSSAGLFAALKPMQTLALGGGHTLYNVRLSELELTTTRIDPRAKPMIQVTLSLAFTGYK